MKIRQIFSSSKKPSKIEIERNVDPFWIQKVQVTKIEDRLPYFKEACFEKKVIHFGCTDFPIFNPANNLHIELAKSAKELHGFDIDTLGIEKLKEYVNQSFFSSFEEVVDQDYDVCLVPETIEHVDNVKDFLEKLSTIKAKKFLITAPNCFAPIHMERNINSINDFQEIVHPDHNCWYSPYTLKNQIEKYSRLKVKKVYLINEERMICCEAEFK